MRQIFNRSTQVTAWLSEEDSATREAFSLIGKIFDATYHISPEHVRDSFWTQSSLSSMGLPQFPNAKWYALTRLFGARYWQRIWVVQELVVSRNAVVRCGSKTIPWAKVEHAARLLLATGWRRAFNSTSRLPVSPRAPVFAKTIANIRTSFGELQGGPGMSLSLLLCVTRRFRATDPRDKILALLGVANNSSRQLIIPNYSSPPETVFLNTTGALIVSENSLALLSTVEDGSRRSLHSLPSWVPDYSVWHSVLTFGFPIGAIRYNACGSTSVQAHWEQDSRLLSLMGSHVDEVSIVADSAFTDTALHEIIIKEWLRLIMPLLRTGKITIEDFWRTLLGDCDRDSFPAPAQGGHHFAAYLDSIGEDQARSFWNHLLVHELGSAMLFQASVETLAWHRKFFVTKNGRIGLGPHGMHAGEKVVIFSGGKVPFIVRKDPTGYKLCGEAYVHGLMHGEAIQDGLEFTEIKLG